MTKKFYLLIVLIVFSIININAQEFSKNFNADYPLFGFNLLGYPSSPSASAFIDETNLMSVSNENENIQVSIENKSSQKGIFSITLLMVVDKQKIAKMQFSMQSDDFSEKNYLTSLKFIDLSSGESLLMEYDGYSQRSLGKVLGGFSQLLELFYNTDKLFLK